MKILAVDDEYLALKLLEKTVEQACSDAEIKCAQGGEEALELARDVQFDAAFLDIDMPMMNGLVLAKKLKELQPRLGIVFTTGYAKYAAESYKVRASGYLLKPISKSDVCSELEYLKTRARESSFGYRRVRVQTFGNFEVFVDDKPVQFARAKAKELLAFLVDKQGTGVTMSEVENALWDDGAIDESRQNQLRVYLSDLKKALAAVKADDIVIKRKNNLMIDKTKIDCDLYRFINGDADAINSYTGQYMYTYPWAEFTVGYLDAKS